MESQSQPPSPRPSPALLAAQAQLAQLRETFSQSAGSKASATASHPGCSGPRNDPSNRGQALLVARRRQEAAWQPSPSDVLKAYRPPDPPSPWAIRFATAGVAIPPPEVASRRPPDSIKVYPGILLGMLERRLEAAGRIWLLLQYLDEQGSGQITVEAARQQLTDPGSELRICNWRNLRGLLQRGEGIFWQRDRQGRVWLKGAGKVAAALGTGRLQGRPVELPLGALLGGVGGGAGPFLCQLPQRPAKQQPD